MYKELVRKSNNERIHTMGEIMDCGEQYVVFDGSDYIGYDKTEYSIKIFDQDNREVKATRQVRCRNCVHHRYSCGGETCEECLKISDAKICGKYHARLKIGIDIDGTITDPYGWLEGFNNLFKQNFTKQDITHYDLKKLYNSEKWGKNRDEIDEVFMDSVKIQKDCIPVIQYLTTKHLCSFVTARDKGKERQTIEFLKNNGLPCGSVHFGGSHDKREIADKLSIDVMIEDSPSNALQLAKHGMTVLLLDNNYNKDVVHKRIIRVKDWDEIYTIIESNPNKLQFIERNTFFTSDTHFGHERVNELCRRPFPSANDMDEGIVREWNNTVDEDDIVYHLGDFGEYDKIKELNGKTILICGNYERKDMKELEMSQYKFREYLISKGFYDVVFEDIHTALIEFEDEEYEISMSHEPSKIKDSKSDINLFGHIHGLQMVKRFGLNVGVDCHHFTPVNMKDVIFFTDSIKNVYDDEVYMV